MADIKDKTSLSSMGRFSAPIIVPSEPVGMISISNSPVEGLINNGKIDLVPCIIPPPTFLVF